jgi:hypothetical protein
MKLEDLAAEVRRMRDLQRKFFKGDRSSATLEASKAQERRVDRIVADILDGGSLFDREAK